MHFTAPALVAAATVILSASAAPSQEQLTSLLRRQEPGTPAFSCHSSCGTAISLSKNEAPCENGAFLTAYAECLACAGPDDVNIWKYYGASVGAAGEKCRLSTTPGSSEPVEEKPVEEEPAHVETTTSATQEPVETQAPIDQTTEVPEVTATEAPVAEEISAVEKAPVHTSNVDEVIEATSTLKVIVPIATSTGAVVVPSNGTVSPTGVTPSSPAFTGAGATNMISGGVFAAVLAAIAVAL